MPIKQRNVRFSNGNLYLDNALCETYFKGVSSVILLKKTPDILIMPVQQVGSGGLLMKIRNAHGDRVVNASEFLASLNICLPEDRLIPVVWNSSHSALILKLDELENNTMTSVKSNS